MGDATVVVLAKVVSLDVRVDALSGAVTLDERRLGFSAADQAALSVARRLADAHGLNVTLASVVPPRGERALAELASSGANDVVRVALVGDDNLTLNQWSESLSSELVARALDDVVANATYVVTGDHSLDRGSATVPSRIAARHGFAQVLGALEVDAVARSCVRRLDGGWREEVDFVEGTVVSVEASAGRLVRASPGALRATRVRTHRVALRPAREVGYLAPLRAPVDVVAAPRENVAARRAMEVIGALSAPKRREVLTLGAEDAARTILDRLAQWGYE